MGSCGGCRKRSNSQARIGLHPHRSTAEAGSYKVVVDGEVLGSYDTVIDAAHATINVDGAMVVYTG
jgi:hypothetical protein